MAKHSELTGDDLHATKVTVFTGEPEDVTADFPDQLFVSSDNILYKSNSNNILVPILSGGNSLSTEVNLFFDEPSNFDPEGVPNSLFVDANTGYIYKSNQYGNALVPLLTRITANGFDTCRVAIKNLATNRNIDLDYLILASGSGGDAYPISWGTYGENDFIGETLDYVYFDIVLDNSLNENWYFVHPVLSDNTDIKITVDEFEMVTDGVRYFNHPDTINYGAGDVDVSILLRFSRPFQGSVLYLPLIVEDV
jgi:hypothetical protein